jgi:hypothetical protein
MKTTGLCAPQINERAAPRRQLAPPPPPSGPRCPICAEPTAGDAFCPHHASVLAAAEARRARVEAGDLTLHYDTAEPLTDAERATINRVRRENNIFGA